MSSQKSFSNRKFCFNKSKFIVFTIFLFLVYFFSNNLIYSQTLKKSDSEYLVPIGQVLQIDAELKNLIVRNNCEESPFLVGDSILKINDCPIVSYGDFSKILCELPSDDKISLLVGRMNKEITITTTKEILQKVNFNNLISGFATLTYINPDTNEFGAVAHGINVGGSKKVPIKTGFVSTTKDLNIEKSHKGSVGSINALKADTIGEFNQNASFGIKGKISNFSTKNLKKYKVASLDEVKLGKAQIILQTTSDKYDKYDIEIISVENQRNPQPKTFKIRILDKDLMFKTGGIVQGMSGTPIIQGDKIIGAISHAVENDPSYGYGVFIKWMTSN